MIDLALAELLAVYDLRWDSGVTLQLLNRVRNKIRPAKKLWAQDHEELQEEQLAPDESREIEAPAGSSAELEQLWEGTLDPFEFLARHRGGKLQEIDYQIFVGFAAGKTSAQIGAELGLAASTVRDRVQACRRRFFGK